MKLAVYFIYFARENQERIERRVLFFDWFRFIVHFRKCDVCTYIYDIHIILVRYNTSMCSTVCSIMLLSYLLTSTMNWKWWFPVESAPLSLDSLCFALMAPAPCGNARRSCHVLYAGAIIHETLALVIDINTRPYLQIFW